MKIGRKGWIEARRVAAFSNPLQPMVKRIRSSMLIRNGPIDAATVWGGHGAHEWNANGTIAGPRSVPGRPIKESCALLTKVGLVQCQVKAKHLHMTCSVICSATVVVFGTSSDSDQGSSFVYLQDCWTNIRLLK